MFFLLIFLGAIGGFLSGLLGLGGALILIPLMLVVPDLCGLGRLDMKTITGLSMIQVFFTSLSGYYRHRKNQFVHKKLLLTSGLSLTAGSALGSAFSGYVSNHLLTMAFGVIALLAGILMLFPEKKTNISLPDTGMDTLTVHTPFAITSGFIVGLLAGMVGAGGGFILIPIMINLLHIPVRIAIGTSLGIILMGSVAGAIGKIATGQVDWFLAVALIIGSVPLAQLGAIVSKKVPHYFLRILLVIIIFLTCLQIWYELLF
jgi:hypothetical protein